MLAFLSVYTVVSILNIILGRFLPEFIDRESENDVEGYLTISLIPLIHIVVPIMAIIYVCRIFLMKD